MSDNDNHSRPKRSTNQKKNEKFNLLDQIKNAKKSGTNFKQLVEEQDIYEVVDEIEYDKLREKRQRDNFIEGDSEYCDDGREIFDASDDEEISHENNKRKKSTKNSNLVKSKKSRLGGQPSLDSMIFKGKTKSNKKETDIPVDISDLLAELAQTVTPKRNSEIVNPYQNKKERVRYDIHKPKENKPARNEPIKTKPNESSKLADKKIDMPVVRNLPLKTAIENKPPVEVFVSPKKVVVEKSSEPHVDYMDFSDLDFEEPFESESQGFSQATPVEKRSAAVWLNDEIQTTQSADKTAESQFAQTETATSKQVFWYEAYHDRKIQGVVFLFGKMYDSVTKSFINCGIRVHELERRLYFLPKDDSEVQDVHDELRSVFATYGIESFRCKPVTKKYAFQLTNVPDEANYLMVQYDSKFPDLPHNITGRTFSHVFGIETSCLETFILDLKLKGPCWLNFASLDAAKNQFSVCKNNFDVYGLKGISKTDIKIPNPPFSILSLNIKTVVNKKTNFNEIVSIGCFVHSEVYLDQPPPTRTFQSHFTMITHPKDNVMPYDVNHKLKSSEWGVKCKDTVTVMPNERSLINCFLAKLQLLDPDLIVGHSLFGYQLEILLQRCQVHNITLWHRIGRLKRSVTLPKNSNKSWLEKMATAGRIICDIGVSARELVKCRSYELQELVKEILPKNLHSLLNSSEVGDLSKLFINSVGVKQLIDITMDEAISNLYLMHELQVLPLALQITTICGNLISRTLSSGKSERNEFLLLHAFTENNYLVPDKNYSQADFKTDTDLLQDDQDANYAKRKPTYLGGLVLEPKKGFYENFILLMDFNSLYPSIIQEFNICFTTIDRFKYLQIDENLDKESPDFASQQLDMLMKLSMESAMKNPGILPTEIKKLVDSRKQVKSLLNTPNLSKEKKIQYDIRQKALKITANSMYGCLGFSHSRFQATQLAALVTSQGRDILMKTKELVESGAINVKFDNQSPKIAFDIVYGDTDSVMVNSGMSQTSDYEKVLKIGQRIKEEVNKLHKLIQIDIDGVFRRLLLLKKKKYAALTIVGRNAATGQLETKQELKGLDIVRRDWCKLAVEVGQNAVTKILEGDLSQEDLAESIHSYLRTVADDLRNGKIDLSKFVITKSLARNPEMYNNAQGQPHVQVALRLNNAGSVKVFRAKDTVEYVICIDGTNESPAQRAYSPKELLDSIKSTDKRLTIDLNYYLSNQLHPVVCRLVECIEGMNLSTVAESLGIDASKYRNLVIKNGEEIDDIRQQALTEVDNFKDCRPLIIKCIRCNENTVLDYRIENGKLWQCTKCNRDMLSSRSDAIKVAKKISLIIRKMIHWYYSLVFVCQEIECQYVCKELPLTCHVRNSVSLTKENRYICPSCGQGVMQQLVTDDQLSKQLTYYHHLFSTQDKLPHAYSTALQVVLDHIDVFMKQSKYRKIDLGQLFVPLTKSKNKHLVC